jgi:hypothetical protein
VGVEVFEYVGGLPAFGVHLPVVGTNTLQPVEPPADGTYETHSAPKMVGVAHAGETGIATSFPDPVPLANVEKYVPLVSLKMSMIPAFAVCVPPRRAKTSKPKPKTRHPATDVMELLLSVIYLNFTTEESTKDKFLNIFDTGTVQACFVSSGYVRLQSAPHRATASDATRRGRRNRNTMPEFCFRQELATAPGEWPEMGTFAPFPQPRRNVADRPTR